MTDVNEDVTASSTSTEETKTLLEGLTPMVAEVRDDITAGKPPAHSIGKLKMLDKVLESTKGTPTAAGLKLMFEVCELCLLLLPEDTRKALEATASGSDVALELVRRNLTQLAPLAKTLYNATAEDLDADEGLRSLHGALASGLELYGTLVDKGIDPAKRPWAQRLTDRFSSLSELRRLSWARLQDIVGLTVPPGVKKPTADDAIVSDEEQAEAAGGDTVGEDTDAMHKVAVLRKTPVMPRGELNVLEDLFAAGIATGTPSIRRGCLDFGLGLDAAHQLEMANIMSPSKLTESNIRTFQSRLKVEGMSEDDVKAALNSMVSNKTSVLTVNNNQDEGDFFRKCDTNEELVAAAGGGLALYGINFFPNKDDVTLKPYAPLLKQPMYIDLAGASASFEASVLQSTELSMASNFTKTTDNGGISIAQASSSSWGVSASVSGFGNAGTAGASSNSTAAEDEKESTSNAFSANNKTTTTTATMVESIVCPMRSFRIPVSDMRMSEEALESALSVDTLLKAGSYLDTFGSHVSNGRHLLGGIFFKTITMTSETEVATSTLLAAASTQMQATRTCSVDVSATFGGGTSVVDAKASASMGSASSSGVVTFKSSGDQEDKTTTDSRAMFQTYVRAMGPNVATPELFAEKLFTDSTSWTVIDRGPFEALVPITQVMETMLPSFDAASASKRQLENAMNLLTVAWQQRAAVWKRLENDPAVPTPLRNMIRRSFATEDAHDQIRAAVVDLFEIVDLSSEADLVQISQKIGDMVIAAAAEMQEMPAGQANFFDTLERKLSVAGKEDETFGGTYGFKPTSNEYMAASRSAKRLSSTDWNGFDLIWTKRQGTLAIQDALEKYVAFEGATLRYGEEVTLEQPLVSINKKFMLEIFANVLRIVNTENGSVVDTIFRGYGVLGRKASAHLAPTGEFVVDLTMTTGFSMSETKMILWTAPNTEGKTGSYGRMQNDGKFVIFDCKGKQLWSTQ